MNKTTFAVAQLENIRHDIPGNIEKHILFSKTAAAHGANIIIFPEMSLTGYEREHAADEAFTAGDVRLDELQKVSDSEQITIIAGLPLKLEKKLYIGSAIISPWKRREFYIKKYLHEGEEVYFSSRDDYDPVVSAGDEKASCAICYDIEVDDHARFARSRGTSIYLAGIFYSAGGIKKGLQRLESIAKEFSMAVIMSNYCGKCWGLEAGGNSSVWSKEGTLIIRAGDEGEAVLLAEKSRDQWKAKEIII